MKEQSIPDGYHTLTPYLAIHGVPSVIEFLKQAFDAEEKEIHRGSDGGIRNAEIRIGSSMVLMGEKPKDQKPFPGMLYMYVDDVDSYYNRAIQAGGRSLRVPADQDYGDRVGGVEDSSGNQWWIAKRLMRQ
jgi:uncharacterized glyoxalase superfamily protein PhnB